MGFGLDARAKDYREAVAGGTRCTRCYVLEDGAWRDEGGEG